MASEPSREIRYPLLIFGSYFPKRKSMDLSGFAGDIKRSFRSKVSHQHVLKCIIYCGPGLMPQPMSSRSHGPDRSLREIIEDMDDSSMRIFKMYKNKAYLPHSKRISNIAWRIQNKKVMLTRPHPISPPACTGSTTSANDEGFDYADHILHLLRQNSLHHSQSLNRSLSSNSTHSRHSSQGRTQSDCRIPPTIINKTLTSSPVPLSNKLDLKNRISTTNPNSFHLERSDLSKARESAIHRTTLLTKRMPYSEPESPRPVLQCSHCFSQSTPMWRQGPSGELLCNACGLYNKLHGSLRQPHPSRQKDRQVQVNNTRLFMNAQSSPISTHLSTRADYSARAANDEIPDWDNLLASTGSNFNPSASHPTLSAYTFQGLAPATGELTSMDIDEIDNLLNMNLFHPESSHVNNLHSRADQSLNSSHTQGSVDPLMNNAPTVGNTGNKPSSLPFHDQFSHAPDDDHFSVSAFNGQASNHLDHLGIPLANSGIGHSTLHLNNTAQNFGQDPNMQNSHIEQTSDSLYSWLDFPDPSPRPR